jgi:hypothetical protein
VSQLALRRLAALVLALAGAVILDRPPPRAVSASDRVLPALAAGAVRRVELARAGVPPTVLESSPGGWRVDGHPADPAAVRDLLGGLEYLAWRRRLPPEHGAARGLDPPRLRVHVDDGRVPRELLIGRAQPGLGRTWATTPGAAYHYLVEDHAARALDLGAADLRRRRAIIVDAARLRIDEGERAVAFSGRPPCVTAPAGGCALADRERVGVLVDGLEAVALARFLDGPPPSPAVRAFASGTEALAIHGDCPSAIGERAVTSSAGAGCVADADLAPLLAAPIDPLAWVERAVTSLDPNAVDRIRAGDVVLERRGGSWRRGEAELDGQAVRAWLETLASVQGAPSWTRTPPSGEPTVELGAGARREALRLEGDVVRRDVEPLALAIPRAARAAFALDLVALTDRRVVELDATALAELVVEEPGAPAAIVRRGATLDDWRVLAPAGATADLAAIAALRSALAPLVGDPVAPGRFVPARRLTLVADPDGARVVVELTADCRVRRAGEPLAYRLRPAACSALSARFTR